MQSVHRATLAWAAAATIASTITAAPATNSRASVVVVETAPAAISGLSNEYTVPTAVDWRAKGVTSPVVRLLVVRPIPTLRLVRFGARTTC
jgi:hypothetical protein